MVRQILVVDDEEQIRDAGFEDCFTKPADLTELIEAAEHAFRKLERWRN